MADLAEGMQSGLTSSDTEQLLETYQQPRRSCRVRTFTLLGSLLVVCAIASFWHNPATLARVRRGLFLGLAEESADSDSIDEDAGRDDSCAGLPYVMLEEVVSSNLGKKGPDEDAEEGIIYKASAHHAGEVDTANLEIHVHSLRAFNETDDEESDQHDDNYQPAFTHGEYVNGIHGRFATISVKPGQKVKVRVHAYDADKKKDIRLPHGAISFFDLDGGKRDENGTLHSKEHVEVCSYKDYYLTNETSINVEVDEDCAVFTATEQGTGDDNPSDPLALTQLQKNRAVTLEFEDTSKFNFEVGATGGEMPRVFSFVFRPSLLCAMTKMDDGHLVAARGEEAPIVPVRSAAQFMKLPSVALLLGLGLCFA